MHLSIFTQLPISFFELTISSPRASVMVAIPTLNEAVNLPWVMRKMPSYVDEVVSVGGRSHNRQGSKPFGCKGTDICIRSRIGAPGSRVVYEPLPLVRHHVPAHRGTLRYMPARSRSEGISKAQVSQVAGRKRALAARSRLHNPAEQDSSQHAGKSSG